MSDTTEPLKLHEWDWLGKTQRAVVGARTGSLAFHYRKVDTESVRLVIELANATLDAANPAPAGLDDHCKELIAALEVRGVTFDQFAATLDAANPAPVGRIDYADELAEAMQEVAEKRTRGQVFVTREDAMALILALGRRHLGLISDAANPAPVGLTVHFVESDGKLVDVSATPDPAPAGLPVQDRRLFLAVRQYIREGIDAPGVQEELHAAFYEARDAATPAPAGLDALVQKAVSAWNAGMDHQDGDGFIAGEWWEAIVHAMDALAESRAGEEG